MRSRGQISTKKRPGHFRPGEFYREVVKGEGGQALDEYYNQLGSRK